MTIHRYTRSRMFYIEEELMKELMQPSEKEIVRRVVREIFTDDDDQAGDGLEDQHQVRRQQSFMVCYIFM